MFGASDVRLTQLFVLFLETLNWYLGPPPAVPPTKVAAVFAVAILGGIGSFRGGIISAFILAFARQTTVIVFNIFQDDYGIFPLQKWLDSIHFLGFHGLTFASGYADGIGFAILIVVLLFRPQGIMGTAETGRERV